MDCRVRYLCNIFLLHENSHCITLLISPPLRTILMITEWSIASVRFEEDF